jgi:16S rRNA pseudouridine516 synthase
MRLDKFVSNMLPFSRKEVKVFCREGRIQVNDKTAVNGEVSIDPVHDRICFDGKIVEYMPYVYLMLNKPAGYVSATEDRKLPTVLELVPEEYAHFELFPMGRLDIDTEGLLILTNDGILAHDILSPKKHVDKVYYARIEGEPGEKEKAIFADGITLEDGYQTLPAKLDILSHQDGRAEIELTIREGKFHQVKRMFEAVGMRVAYLKRMQMGEVRLDPELALGQVRSLTKEEIRLLQRK